MDVGTGEDHVGTNHPINYFALRFYAHVISQIRDDTGLKGADILLRCGQVCPQAVDFALLGGILGLQSADQVFVSVDLALLCDGLLYQGIDLGLLCLVHRL